MIDRYNLSPEELTALVQQSALGGGAPSATTVNDLVQRGPAPPPTPIPNWRGPTPPPVQLSDADLWEYYRARGLTPDEATQHVQRRSSAKAGQAIGQRERDAAVPHASHTAGTAIVRNAAQAATSGFGDEIAAASMAMMGPPPQNLKEQLFGTYFTRPAAERGPIFDQAQYVASRDAMRQNLAESRVEHPVASIVGTGLGVAANPLTKLTGPLTAGLGPMAAGATQGAILGGVQGLGEGEGTLKQRLPTAAIGAGAGLVSGAILGKLLPTFGVLWKNIRSAFPKGTPVPVMQGAAEDAMRTTMTKQGLSPAQMEEVLATWRATAGPRGAPLAPLAPKTPVAPPEPIRVQPGVTVTPTEPVPPPEPPTGGGRPNLRIIPRGPSGDVPPVPPTGGGPTLSKSPTGNQLDILRALGLLPPL